MKHGDGGKGSQYRKVNQEKFNASYDRIFKKKKETEQKPVR